MKAIVIKEFGAADKLEISEIEKPQISDDQVLIRVKAAGINPVDTKIRSGAHRSAKTLQLPAVLGKDVSGVIELTGKNVQGFKVGDAVFGCAAQTYAEYVAASPDLIVKKPENITFEEAAAVSLAALTAYQAIHEHLKIRSGQHVLVQSAAGGVGHLAVQLARIAGAVVSGTASGRNIGFIKSLGADQAIDYKNERFEEVVKDLDAVLDTMGGEILYRSIQCVKPGGTVVCLPSSTKDDPKAIQYAQERGVSLIWFMMEPKKEQLQEISDLLAAGQLKVSVEKVWPMESIVQAHQEIEAHGVRGKLVVRIA
ncbi:NADP-dependent oxidoreductase [Pedobacter heparinus]|uniref:Alcohol dehydrogenase zinc-binding domain protein n=1 Tax=Pedobacter heparinus (strain ATCC 13125 / DSM 2366 / CIP 104194 / JCM 7457 / NBRC 12017 / NCIMB 9290 / NRRL B-14731 / HIM 762-3) TaxID=485917 RepID=C6Y3A8_PEDHD|nr:NADP-dependent oxidoreductase [Pedobacter heparinus]ACU05333.1 Alcohol dehydrogenase zinc-binding domain protein [Pedobacter heparinus DSM 2366]